VSGLRLKYFKNSKPVSISFSMFMFSKICQKFKKKSIKPQSKYTGGARKRHKDTDNFLAAVSSKTTT
jgi:hypothetical protein